MLIIGQSFANTHGWYNLKPVNSFANLSRRASRMQCLHQLSANAPVLNVAQYDQPIAHCRAPSLEGI